MYYVCIYIYIYLYRERERVRERERERERGRRTSREVPVARDRALQLVHIPLPLPNRDFFIDNLLVRIHFIIVIIRWTGLAPWESPKTERCSSSMSHSPCPPCHRPSLPCTCSLVAAFESDSLKIRFLSRTRLSWAKNSSDQDWKSCALTKGWGRAVTRDRALQLVHVPLPLPTRNGELPGREFERGA